MTDKQMQALSLENIALACGGSYIGDPERKQQQITGAVTDSRQVEEGYLFIAIRGERVDGHRFIPQVFEKGALAVLSEQKLEDPAGPYILVESSTEAMKKIAAFYRDQLTIPVVGIIGSVGKTSTKEMVSSVLSQKYEVLKTAGNFNNEIGLPLTIFRIHKQHQVAVLEMGISDFNEMHRLGAMAKPDIAVLTNIGWCHLENLKTRDGILQAKTEVFDHMQPGGIAVMNGDDDKLTTRTLVNGKAPIFYGIGEQSIFCEEGSCQSGSCGMEVTRLIHKQVYATEVENLGFEGMRANFHTPKGDFSATIHIPGEHNVHNALAAAAVGIQLGLTTEEIRAGIEAAQTIAGRTNFLHVGGMIVIDDCYNANPVSMKASIDTLSHGAGRTIAVLGDMGELGEDEAALHAEVGTFLGEKKIPVLFCAGKLAENYARAAARTNPNCDIHYFPEREAMTEALCAFVREGDSVLVKASHFMEFPRVVEALKQL